VLVALELERWMDEYIEGLWGRIRCWCEEKYVEGSRTLNKAVFSFCRKKKIVTL